MSNYDKAIKKIAAVKERRNLSRKESNETKIRFKEFEKMQIDGQSPFFHNNIAIQSWLDNPRVDATQKVFMALLYLYTLESNKNVAIHERLTIQNTRLMAWVNIQERSTVQKALRYLTRMGIIEDRIYLAKGETYSLKDGVRGITKRRIILNLKRAKEFLTALPEGDFFDELNPRSRERRLIYRRPLSLVNHLVKATTEAQVNDINNKKNKHQFNQYLQKQLDTYSDFSMADVEQIVSTLEDTENYCNALQRIIQGDLVPPDLRGYLAA